ncbi:MAG: thioredoxin family protein [Calditrichaceae bacterium]
MTKLSTKKIVRNDMEMLYGQCSMEQIYFDYPEWELREKNYNPDESTINELKMASGNYEINIFIGTWCSDSEREVPRFHKILKNSFLDKKIKMKIWAVDRKKKLENDLPEKFDIKRVPTFIIIRDGKEIGRIIESPADTLEKDFLQILKQI